MPRKTHNPLQPVFAQTQIDITGSIHTLLEKLHATLVEAEVLWGLANNVIAELQQAPEASSLEQLRYMKIWAERRAALEEAVQQVAASYLGLMQEEMQEEIMPKSLLEAVSPYNEKLKKHQVALGKQRGKFVAELKATAPHLLEGITGAQEELQTGNRRILLQHSGIEVVGVAALYFLHELAVQSNNAVYAAQALANANHAARESALVLMVLLTLVNFVGARMHRAQQEEDVERQVTHRFDVYIKKLVEQEIEEREAVSRRNQEREPDESQLRIAVDNTVELNQGEEGETLTLAAMILSRRGAQGSASRSAGEGA